MSKAFAERFGLMTSLIDTRFADRAAKPAARSALLWVLEAAFVNFFVKLLLLKVPKRVILVV